MLLKDIQAKIPTADSVVGRCICFHEGLHRDLGEYVGDGIVVLNLEGEKIIASFNVEQADAEVVSETKVERKSKAKAAVKKDPAPDLDFGDLGASLNLD